MHGCAISTSGLQFLVTNYIVTLHVLDSGHSVASDVEKHYGFFSFWIRNLTVDNINRHHTIEIYLKHTQFISELLVNLVLFLNLACTSTWNFCTTLM